MTAQDEAWERLKRSRENERKALAAALGITLPVMPPRLEGESDKDYGVRIAWIAKSHCGPAPKASAPLRPLPKLPAKPEAAPAPEPEADGERLASWPDEQPDEDSP